MEQQTEGMIELVKTYEIKYYEQNLKNELKESSLLNFLQDAATVSAENLGFGPSFVFSHNYAWFVLKYHIELYNPVKNMDSIVIKTVPRGAQRLYAYRDFEICTKENEKIGRASSLWSLIDMKEKKMLSAEKALPFMFKYEKRVSDPAFIKMPEVENFDFIKEFEVRFDDVDVNRHANNANYLIWALETLPYDFRLKKTVKTIDINYRKEVSAGASIICESKIIDNNKTIHFVKDSCEKLCSIQIEWDEEPQLDS